MTESRISRCVYVLLHQSTYGGNDLPYIRPIASLHIILTGLIFHNASNLTVRYSLRSAADEDEGKDRAPDDSQSPYSSTNNGSHQGTMLGSSKSQTVVLFVCLSTHRATGIEVWLP
jgi:hypothetical protein